MTINEIQQQVLRSVGKRYIDTDKLYGVSPKGATVKLGRGLENIKDLAMLCEFCDAELLIRLNNGGELPVTTETLQKERG